MILFLAGERYPLKTLIVGPWPVVKAYASAKALPLESWVWADTPDTAAAWITRMDAYGLPAPETVIELSRDEKAGRWIVRKRVGMLLSR